MKILCNRVIRSFCFSGDSLGAMLAMEELETLLGVSPGPETLEIFLTHVSHDLQRLEAQLGADSSSGEVGDAWAIRMEDYEREAEWLLKETYKESKASLSDRNDGVKRPTDLSERSLERERNGPALRQVLSGFLTNVLEMKFTLPRLQQKLERARREMGLVERERADEGMAFLRLQDGKFGYA